MTWWHPALAFVITYAVLLLLLKTSLRSIALDQPNHRSLHDKVIPRTGGLAVVAGFIVSAAVMYAWFWVFPLLPLLAISLLDDIVDVSVHWRFLVQLAVSVAFVVLILPNMSVLGMALIILGMVWMINLYNFMDGSDGLAGGMALFGFGSYAAAAWLANDGGVALLCGSLAASSIAFLRFNFHPARIFLGDSGSIPLGFLAGALGLYGWEKDLWPAWFPLLVFAPFILDASITLLRRLLRGERVWQAHRSHYYQRLVQMGWGHSRTALAEYLLMLATGISAIFMLQAPEYVSGMLCMWVILYFCLIYWVDKRWRNFSS